MNKMMSELSERESNILKALIDHYIATAEPVSSRTLAKQYNIGLSPATIRNTLKDLEDKGLIDQPHTSAGRVPTDYGYGIYVSNLLIPTQLTSAEEDFIIRKINNDYTEIDMILDQTSRMLGKLSHQLGVTVAPKFNEAVLMRLELIPVAEKKLMVVMVVKSGLVKSILFEMQSNLADMGLSKTTQLLNERLCGLTLGEIKKTIHRRLGSEGAADPKLIKLFLESDEHLWDLPGDNKLHFSGTSNLFQQPEFQQPKSMAEVVELIEDRKAISELISDVGITEGLTISIGHKEKNEKADQISLLTSSYNVGDFKGVVGIIGPKRMNYSKMVSLVDYTAKMLSKILTDSKNPK